jgi:ribosomal protein L40E
MALTRHCYQCGWEYPLRGNPGRTEVCHQCGADLKVCLNCVHYDPKVAEQCREKRADLVQEKHLANFCEYFDFARREWRGRNASAREEAARASLKKLLGD